MPAAHQVSDRELLWLNVYRASELHGGLMLGRLARYVRDPQLMLHLTRHAAEEIKHAQLWTETILAVGGKPRPIRNTYQQIYAREIGPISSVLRILVLTQVFEQRVSRHFMEHACLPGTHPEIVRTLNRMVEEEKLHLSWVSTWLDRQASEGRAVSTLMDEYRMVDQLVYDELRAEYDFPLLAKLASQG